MQCKKSKDKKMQYKKQKHVWQGAGKSFLLFLVFERIVYMEPLLSLTASVSAGFSALVFGVLLSLGA